MPFEKSIYQKKVNPLKPFEQNFFFRELNKISGKISIGIQLDRTLELSDGEFKQQVILKLLEKEPLLRSRIYYNDSIEPSTIIHDVEEFKGDILDGLLIKTNLGCDSPEFYDAFIKDPFKSNDSFDSLKEPNWAIAINREENFISFLFSHVLFDGMSGVHVQTFILEFLNCSYDKKESKSMNEIGKIMYVYPKNEKTEPFPPEISSPDKETKLFEIPNTKVNPWPANIRSESFTLKSQSKVDKIIKTCKYHDVSLNAYLLAMLAISTFEGKEVKCHFSSAVSLRGRKIIDDKVIPKTALGLMITFISITTPKIDSQIAELGSEKQWQFIKWVHSAVQKCTASSVEDLKSFGNFAFIDQKKAWEEQMKNLTSEKSKPSCTFSVSNLSFNFKFNSKKHYNVSRSVFLQTKNPTQYFTNCVISNSGCFDLNFNYDDDGNNILHNTFKRFKSNMSQI
ncbi:hypothetical protein QEN19_000371 [Hanseniaspora menglaensis]